MTLKFTKQAEKDYQKLPLNIQKKADKQLTLLLSNYRHPSLRTRKMSGENHFEARVDLRNRFTYMMEGEDIYILTIGPHDEGLGKK